MRARPTRRSQRGQSLVEFAAGSLVLLLLLVGAGELGRAFFFAVSIQGAAREAARSAAWFSSGNVSTPNPGLNDSSILDSVRDSLSGTGVTAVSRPGPNCLAGAAPHDNPPYDESAYPVAAGEAWVYACYRQPGGGSPTGEMAAPDPAYLGGDVQVSILLSYGLATGLLKSQLGISGLHLAASTHMRVQGSQ